VEIERRARINDINNLILKLDKIGAKPISTKNQIDTYYGSIELYKKIGYSFVTRIRESDSKYILTVKTAKPKKDGIWEEFETEIDKPKTYDEMFVAMGLEKIITVQKERRMFKFENITVNIDTFKNEGTFIEIELISDKPETEKLSNFMDKIKIKPNDIIKVGYISLFLKDKKSKFAEFVKN